MTPEQQWEWLRDLGPVGSMMAALISVLNLIVVTWWKSQRNDMQEECQTQQRRHDSAVKDLYTRIREDSEAQTLAREKAIREIREYADDERHNLREWMQAQVVLMESRMHQIEKDNRDCEKDRRELAVSMAKKP